MPTARPRELKALGEEFCRTRPALLIQSQHAEVAEGVANVVPAVEVTSCLEASFQVSLRSRIVAIRNCDQTAVVFDVHE
jgi:hypothetical protein